MAVNNIKLSHPALIAGIGLLVITVLAIFANFFVFEEFIVNGNGAETAANVANNPELFRLGIASFLLLTMIDVVIAWALYMLLRPVNKALAGLMAVFRVIAATIQAAAVTNLLNVVYLAEAPSSSSVDSQVDMFATAFAQNWNIALAFFGVHLLLLGYLAIRSGFMPKWLVGALLLLAGAGYLFDSFAGFLIADNTFEVAVFTFFGELFLLIWLLAKGRKIPVKQPG